MASFFFRIFVKVKNKHPHKQRANYTFVTGWRQTIKTKQMKAIELITLLLLLTSCTSNETLNICEPEIEKVNKYFDGIIDNVKSKGYWQDEVIDRLNKDRADALKNIKCD